MENKESTWNSYDYHWEYVENKSQSKYINPSNKQNSPSYFIFINDNPQLFIEDKTRTITIGNFSKPAPSTSIWKLIKLFFSKIRLKLKWKIKIL